MPFDPDAYLAGGTAVAEPSPSQGGFDPDKYLASQGGGFNPDRYLSATRSYDTPLSPVEEAHFQVWKSLFAPKDSGADYDLRGAFKAGLTPSAATGHWPDTFKKPNHPTFSDQSIYAKAAPERAGHWQGETYIPPSSTPATDAAAAGSSFLDRALALARTPSPPAFQKFETGVKQTVQPFIEHPLESTYKMIVPQKEDVQAIGKLFTGEALQERTPIGSQEYVTGVVGAAAPLLLMGAGKAFPKARVRPGAEPSVPSRMPEVSGEAVAGPPEPAPGPVPPSEARSMPGTQEVPVTPEVAPEAAQGEGSGGFARVQPEPAVGTVRLYHGGAGEQAGSDFTTSLQYAQGYADKAPGGKVWYVDVPEGSLKTHDEYGLPMTRVVVPDDVANQARPLSEPAVATETQPAGTTEAGTGTVETQPITEGEPNAGSQPSPEGPNIPQVREEVGGGAPLRQPGEAPQVQGDVGGGESEQAPQEAVSGISNERLTQIYGEDAIIAGKGRGPQAWKAIGAADPRDPYTVLSKAQQQGIATPADVANLRNEHARLLADARAVYGTPEYAGKAQAAVDMANSIKGVAHGPASDVFRALQEADIPRYDSPADFDNIIRERMNRESTQEETATFKKATDEIKSSNGEAVRSATEARTRLRRSRPRAAKEHMRFDDAAEFIKKQIAELTKDCTL